MKGIQVVLVCSIRHLIGVVCFQHVPLEVRITANQHKMILNYHLYPTIAYTFKWGYSSRMSMLQSRAAAGQLDALNVAALQLL